MLDKASCKAPAVDAVPPMVERLFASRRTRFERNGQHLGAYHWRRRFEQNRQAHDEHRENVPMEQGETEW